MNPLLPALFLLATYAGNDSTPINHVQDGMTTEWSPSMFQADEESGVGYAFDNDGTSFYVAMQVADFREQLKIMRMGMRFFIDVKGKKKENTGIEFPVKRDQQPGSGFTKPEDQEKSGERPSFDKKAIRESMMMNMIMLRTFGFDDQTEPKDQSLVMNNSVNIAFTWDDSDIMHIEYRIPLSMVDKISNLKDKTISVGWKVNGVDIGSATGGNNFGGQMSSGRHAAGRPPRPAGNNGGQESNFEKMMKEQSIWTKYIFRFSSM